jgi:type I restriction enzyme S subunit
MMSCIATVGKCGVTQRPSFTNQQINSVIPRDGTDSRFLSYVFTQLGHELESAGGGGSVYTNVSKSRFADIKVELPEDVNEQRAIAHILGTLDDKIELNRRMSETLEAMARALFKSWFVDFDPVRIRRGEPMCSPNVGADTQVCPYMTPDILDLFPSRLVDSELGEIPEGWEVKSSSDFIERLPVGQKYEQKTVSLFGTVPVLDQGKSGVIGYHDNAPDIVASTDAPVVVFANHTCYMRLIPFPFSAIQNVLPFIGKSVDTIWAFYATVGKQPFVEYKGHWPDFVIHKIAVPESKLTRQFARLMHPLIKKIWMREDQCCTLGALRDTLLPKLISGELRVKDAERFVGRAV